MISAQIENLQPTATVIISIALMLSSGFLMTRLTKLLKIPDVTAYIIAGILIGPYCFNIIPEEIISGSDFLADIALAFIAFSTGEYFEFETMKSNGLRVIIITVLEACAASAVIFAVMYCMLKLSLPFSILLSALAAATAPASTIMTIRQTHASGDFVNTLLQVVALDDVVGLIEYSVAISIALVSLNEGHSFQGSDILNPILINLGVLLLGSLFGFLLKFLLSNHSNDNRLIISIAIIFMFCGICTALGVSPLLGCMSMAMIYINTSHDKKLFMQLNYFSPPILLLFFVHSGMSFDLSSLVSSTNTIGHTSLLMIGTIYFFFRIIGKYAGAWAGCFLTGKERKTRDYLGLALIPQAGVAVGLAAMCARTIGGQIGNDLQTIILASSVLYELIGPGCGKLALYLSGSYSAHPENTDQVSPDDHSRRAPTQLEILSSRIHQIQADLPKHLDNEDEEAFTEAAMEYESHLPIHRGRFINSH